MRSGRSAGTPCPVISRKPMSTSARSTSAATAARPAGVPSRHGARSTIGIGLPNGGSFDGGGGCCRSANQSSAGDGLPPCAERADRVPHGGHQLRVVGERRVQGGKDGGEGGRQPTREQGAQLAVADVAHRPAGKV